MRMRMMCVLVALATGSASGSLVSYDGFADASGLTLNGWASTAATADGTVLRLTPASSNKAGSAFSSALVDATGFSTYFEFRITDPGGPLFDGNSEPGADGFVFVVQPVSSDLGGAGGGIGYSGISPSVGVEFDTWHNSAMQDPNSNHVGVDLNGSVYHGAGAPDTAVVNTKLDNGEKWFAWIDYDSGVLEVRASTSSVRPVDALLTKELDLVALLGQETAYVGFTSGTGSDWANHDILRWQYTEYAPEAPPFTPVPEPLTALAVLGGVGVLGRYVRTRFNAA